jgi:hypothetical protein
MCRFRWQNVVLGVAPLAVVVAHAATLNGSEGATKPRTAFKLPTSEPGSQEHALMPLIRHAEATYLDVRRSIRDYSCIMVRRERVAGRLRPHEFIYAKVRHRQINNGQITTPFSVYLKFAKPAQVKGREVLYVEGQNDNRMFVRRGGTRFSFVTTQIDPESEIAMNENRYPITDFGIENLLRRLIIQARAELKAPCNVQYLTEAKINGRPATGIVIKPTKRSSRSSFYEARVFVDNELNLPIHYEAYAPPKEAGEQPRLLEQYTYTKLKLNVGYNDIDFDADNPTYQVK